MEDSPLNPASIGKVLRRTWDPRRHCIQERM